MLLITNKINIKANQLTIEYTKCALIHKNRMNSTKSFVKGQTQFFDVSYLNGIGIIVWHTSFPIPEHRYTIVPVLMELKLKN